MAQKETAPVALADATNGPKMKNSTEQIIRTSPQKHKAPVGSAEAPQSLPWASPFRIGADGVYKVDFDEKIQQETVIWVFSPLLVEARTRDLDEQNWGLLLALQTPSKKWHRFALPMAALSNNTYRELLLSMGLQIEHWAQKHLHHYLMSAKPPKFVTCVSKVGWYGNIYGSADLIPKE